MGEQFGSYVVEGRVADGASSTVYKAVQRDTDRVVAIKQLSAAAMAQPEFRVRFRAEARLLATFDDPNIVRVYDFVDEPDRAWLVEEWVDGTGLDRVIAAGRLTPEQALGVMRGALTGLAHAHEAGVVHGDLKPQNVLVDRAGTSKLVDFGLALPIDGTAAVAGTPGYVAPEVLDGAAADPHADVYAAGVLLHELLAGAPLFTGATAAETLAAQHRHIVPEVDDVGSALNDLLNRATALDPARRPANARVLLDTLDAAARERYGSTWPARASVAGVAAAVLGGAGSTAASSSATGTATASTSGHSGVGTAARAARWTPKKWMLGVGAVTGTVAVVTVAVVALTGSPGHASVDGRWTAKYEVTDKFTGSGAVGDTIDNPWTLARTCTGSTCTVSIRVGNDRKDAIQLDEHGDTYTGTLRTRQNCVDTKTGEVLVRGSGEIDNAFSLRITAKKDGKAATMEGTATTDYKVLKAEASANGCGLLADPHGSYHLTVTRTDA